MDMATLHPLEHTLKHIAQLNESYTADIGPCEEPYFLAIDLIENNASILEQSLARQAKNYPTMDSRTQASYFVGQYSWYVPAVAIATFLTENRVPDLAPANIAIRYRTYTWHHGEHSGEAERIDVRFLSGRFACLPDDPESDHPDALIVSDKVALRDWLRSQLESHFSPLINRIHAMSKLGKNAQWRLVADSCASQFLSMGQMINDDKNAQVEGLLFIRAEHSSINNPQTNYVTLTYQDHSDTFLARGGCCRYYTLPEAEYCTSCVLRKPEERDERLLAYMKSKYEASAS